MKGIKSLSNLRQETSMLSTIYAFRSLKDEEDQSTDSIHKLCKLIKETINSLPIGKGNQLAGSFNAEEIESLDMACSGLLGNEELSDDNAILHCHKWFPAHGCVLLKWKTPFDNFHLELLMLDKWKCQGPHAPLTHMTAKADDYSVLSCAPASEKQIIDLNARIEMCITNDSNNKGAGERKPQKTPAYIYAIIQEIITNEKNILPRGGTTDVGRHTGSPQRSTAWYLVSHCFQYLLDQNGLHSLFQKFLFHFHVRNLREYLSTIKHKSLMKDMTNIAMGILDAAVCQATVLENIDDHKELARIIADLRTELDMLVNGYHNTLHDKYKLPGLSNLPSLGLVLSPIVKADSPCVISLTHSEIRQQAVADIHYSLGPDSLDGNFRRTVELCRII